MKARLGIAPIAWSNDDLPELGGDTPLETCLEESRLAGFSGTETGGKFPRTSGELGPILDRHGLKLVSGWYSGELVRNSVEEEKDRIATQLVLFRDLGASVIVYGETSGTVQNRRDAPLTSRPRLADGEFVEYGRKLTALAEHCADYGVPIAFHHHMGTVVETRSEVDLLMRHTGEAVGLLLDTGHITFAGGSSLDLVATHGGRINHVHCKDVRGDVLARVDRAAQSFLDAVLEGVFTVPGDGTIEFEPIARMLVDAGYEGWFVVEAEQDPAKANPFEYAKIGHRALGDALRAAGYVVVP